MKKRDASLFPGTSGYVTRGIQINDRERLLLNSLVFYYQSSLKLSAFLVMPKNIICFVHKSRQVSWLLFQAFPLLQVHFEQRAFYVSSQAYPR